MAAKENFDRKRSAALLAMHEARVKSALKAKKDAERLANQQPVVDDIAARVDAHLDSLDEQVASEAEKQ